MSALVEVPVWILDIGLPSAVVVGVGALLVNLARRVVFGKQPRAAAEGSRRGLLARLRDRAAWRRSTRLVVREPQHALAALDDRGVWRESDTPASLPLGGPGVGLQRTAVEATQDVEAWIEHDLAELWADLRAIGLHVDDEN